MRLSPPGPLARLVNNAGRGGAAGWRLVRVTTDPTTERVWTAAAEAAGFRSVANWVRDALAGLMGCRLCGRRRR